MPIYRNILVFFILIISLGSGYGQFLIPLPTPDPPGEEDAPPLGGGGNSAPSYLLDGPVIDQVSVTLNGPSSANVGDEVTYYVSISGLGLHTSSTYSVISGGTIVSESTGSVRVRWTSAGTRYISGTAIVSGNYYLFSKSVTVNAPTPPAMPSTPSVSTNTCGDKTVTRANPPSGVTWYWQTSSGGTSTSNANSTYSVSSSRTVYLRARGNSSGLWSSSRSVSVTVNPRPGTPATPTVSGNTCGSATATRGTPPTGITWYWQTSDLETSTANSGSTYTATSDGYVYLRARHNSSGCWSSSTSSIYVDIDDVPDIPSNPEVIVGSCGSTNIEIRQGQGRTTVSYYFQGSENGESTDNPAYQDNIVYTSGTYHLRAKSDDGCWSPTVSFYVEVPPIPTTPTLPGLSYTTAGGIELIRDTPEAGYTWYWQGTYPDGTAIDDPGESYHVASSGTYYLRSKEDGEDCWGDPVAIPVTLQAQIPTSLNTLADGPGTIHITWSGAGNETGFVLSRATNPSGPYTTIDEPSAGQTLFIDDNLSPGTPYFYRVQAVVGEEYSFPAAPQSVETEAIRQELQFNGNISAIKWQSYGDEKENLYTYYYDPMNRIRAAQYFNGYTVGGIWTNVSGVGKFDVSDITYDYNGNIETLTRNGQQTGTTQVIDQLSYTYEGNQLQTITDLGDISTGFVDGHPDGQDYAYDANGNATRDLNKGITNITYNSLNLPEVVMKDGGGYIKYYYDATGKKLRQEVYDEDGVLQSQYDYLGEFVYQDGVLKSIQHEEGTIVPDEIDGGWEYRYDIKDHVGNTRLTFTTKPKTFDFAASFESEYAADEEALYYNLAETRVNFSSADANADGGNEVTRINGNQPMGAGVALYVAQGDTLDMEVYGYYEGGSGYSTQSALNMIIGAVAGGFGGVNGGTEAQQATYDAFDNGLSGVGLIGTSNDNVPAAFLNYMLFDEDMTMYKHGFVQISSAANMSHERIFLDDVPVEKEGLAYVWVSNESASLNWVYFDDMNVTLKEGAIIQREDYYPLGLSFNGYKRYDPTYEGTSSNGGLGWKDLGFRQYDQTTGRFHVVDPLAELQLGESPYQYAGNNPINNVDVLGLLIKPEKDKKKRAKRAKQKAKAKTRQAKRNIGLNLKQNNNSRRRDRVKKSKISAGKKDRSGSGDADNGETNNNSDRNGGDEDKEEETNNPLLDTDNVFDPSLFKRDNGTRVNNGRRDRTPRFTPGRVTPKRPEQAFKEPNPTALGKWHRKSLTAADREKLRQELYRNLPYNEARALESLTLLGRDHDPAAVDLKNRIAVLEDEKSFEDDAGSSTQAVQEVLDAIKTANENGESTLDLNALKKKYRGGVHRKRKLKVNGKELDITIVFGFGNLTIDPNQNNPGTNNGRVTYDFDKADGDMAVKVYINSGSVEDLEAYLGISEEPEIDQLLSDILPADISEADKTIYENLLKTAKNDGEVNTNITVDDWVTDQTQDPDYDNPLKDANGKFILDAAGNNTFGTKKRQCWTATEMILNNTAYSSGGASEVYQMAIEHKTNAELVHDQENTNEGIRNIWDHMEAGRPIQVGVHYKDKAGYNWDKSTDHFVVLTKMKYDSDREEFYFEYFDPGTAFENKGTSANNKLYLIKEGDTYIIKALGTGSPALDIGKKYVVTHVRPNGDATFKSGVIYQPGLSSGTCPTIVCE